MSLGNWGSVVLRTNTKQVVFGFSAQHRRTLLLIDRVGIRTTADSVKFEL
jgi:hypothetical protein